MIAIFAVAIQAVPLPEGARELIEQAAETGDTKTLDTVLGLARQSYPDSENEIAAAEAAARTRIAAIGEERAATRTAELRNSSMLENWRGRGELGGFYATGGTEEAGVTAGLELAREGIDWTHKFAAFADWRSSDGDTTREQYGASYEPNYALSERLFAYGLVAGERDRIQGIEARLSLSGGLGWRLIDADSMTLSVKGGPAYRRTDRFLEPTIDRLAALAALDFDWQLSDRLALTQDAEAFVAEGNSTYRSATGLEIDLGSSLLARIAYRIEHESDPPPGAAATDTLTRFTIIYDFE